MAIACPSWHSSWHFQGMVPYERLLLRPCHCTLRILPSKPKGASVTRTYRGTLYGMVSRTCFCWWLSSGPALVLYGCCSFYLGERLWRSLFASFFMAFFRVRSHVSAALALPSSSMAPRSSILGGASVGVLVAQSHMVLLVVEIQTLCALSGSNSASVVISASVS